MPYGSGKSAKHTRRQRTLVMARPGFPPEESEKQPTHSQRRLGLKPTRSGASNHYSTTGTGTSRRTLARTETNGPGTDPGEPEQEERGGERGSLPSRREVGGRARRAGGERSEGKGNDEGEGREAAAGRLDAVAGFSFHSCACWCETRWVDWLASSRDGRRMAPWGAGPG
jgi:hypothetical protein